MDKVLFLVLFAVSISLLVGSFQLAYAGVTHGGTVIKSCFPATLDEGVGGAVISCDWTLTNTDDFGDTILVEEACDFYNDTAVVPSAQCASTDGLLFSIINDTGTVSCADPPFDFECELGVGDSITFFVSALAPGAGTYEDESFVDFFDICESGDSGCPPDIDFGTDSVITTVPKETPSITSDSSVKGPLNPVNFTVSDTATLSDDFFASGIMRFELFLNSTNCDSNVILNETVPVINGIATSSEFDVTMVGDYDWIATYLGDDNNLPASTLCNDPNQSFFATSNNDIPPPQPKPPVGGELLPIDSITLLVAGIHINAAWLIPVVLSILGIGLFIVFTKSENS